MLQLTNRTKFAAALIPMWERDGQEVLLLVVKGTFKINDGGNRRIADQQVPVQFADQCFGDPGASSPRYESDLALFKPNADVVVNGTAYAPGGQRIRSMTVRVDVGTIRKELVVTGDRNWRRGIWGLSASTPVPFAEMPLIYERAFGGVQSPTPKNGKSKICEANPVGRGFYVRSADAAGNALPNVELPHCRVRRWKDRPSPGGFGFVAKGWKPRTQFAGTYGEAWSKTRMPALPTDFDYRFFQAASEGMTCPHLHGNEPVALHGLTRNSPLSFRIPKEEVCVLYQTHTGRGALSPVIDTVIIEPDVDQVILVWRSQVPCSGDALKVKEVLVGSLSPAEQRAYLRGKRFHDTRTP